MGNRGSGPAALPGGADEARNMLRSVGAVLLFALAAGAVAHAETQPARFMVTAVVRDRVSVEAVEQPRRFTLSETDVRRGYKDVSARYVVDSSANEGYLLQLSPRLGLTARVEVSGLSSALVLHQDSVEVYRPQVAEPQDLTLGFRFVLQPDAQPGTYDMPVHVSAIPL